MTPPTPPPEEPSARSPAPAVRPPDAPTAPPQPGGPPTLTWFRLHAGTTVIDFPLRASPGAHTWVATMWPDARAPAGWVRQPWQPGPTGRGFLPVAVELGDVIQFGIEHPTTGRPGPHGTPAMSYWFGYLHAVRPDAILLHGPHPDPHQAYAAAQHALLAQIHNGPADHHGRPPAPHTERGAPTLSSPIIPAQPPATANVAFHGQQATVGDPVHGWLVVPTERLLAAMPHPPHELTQLLTRHVPALTGNEPLLTLAALAAHHLPDQLPSPTQAMGPPGPTSPPSAEPPPAPPQPLPPEASL